MASRKTSNPDDGLPRCKWASSDALQATYHDHEWGRAITTDAGHLERIALEVFQCGLSWRIVLVKRAALKDAFRDFDPKRVAAMTARDADRICGNAEVIRNRAKVLATIHNARCMLDLAGNYRSYKRWLDQLPIEQLKQLPQAIAAFKDAGFKFMGPETVKCYLMGCGKIEPEHEPHCHRSKGKSPR